MPTRIDSGVNAHPIPAGVVLSTDEWHRLTESLGLSGGLLDEVYEVLVGRIDASYNVAHVVRELIDATGEGQSVPPQDLAGQIKRLGQRIRQHEHVERTLAGEIADLRNRLDDRLLAVYEDVIVPLAADLEDRQVELSQHDVVEQGILALTIALRLTDTYDVRDRQDTRPAASASEPQRFTVTLDASDNYFVPDDQETPAAPTLTLWGEPVTTDHPAITYIARHCGPLTGCDGSAGCKAAVVLRAFKDAAAEWWADPITVDGMRGQLGTKVTDELIRLTASSTRHGWLRDIVLTGIDRSRLELAKACTICDGRGSTHRLGCPNA